MPSVKLSPILIDAQLDNNGIPLSGGLIYWYIDGTSTVTNTYSESSGSTPNTWPIVLNTRGEPDYPIFLPTGSAYKAILRDSVGNLIRQLTGISGINDTTSAIITEWVLFGGAATYINTTSFSVVGDQRTTFTAGRRLKMTVSGGDRYATINGTPTFISGVTTVSLIIDSGVLDSGLSTVYYGFLNPAFPSFDSSGVNTATKAGLQAQSWTGFTTGGISGTQTLTPIPALGALVAGDRFRVKFSVSGNGTDTLNVSGLGAVTIKQYDSGGAKVAPNIVLNQLADVEYDGTDWVILDSLPQVPAGQIIDFSGTSAPSGYISCPTTAATISRTTYATLFAAIGTTWGAGNGTTTFNIPFFVIGYTGVQANGNVGTQTNGQVIAHTHTYGASPQNGSGGSAGNGTAANVGFNSTASGSTGGTDNLAAGSNILKCVKY